MNLASAIYELERQKQSLEQKHRNQIQEIDKGLEFLRKNNTTCEKCFGLGKTLRKRACAEDDAPDENDPRDWNTCKGCGGTGKVR